MSSNKNVKRIFLRISAILLVTLLVSGGLFVLQIGMVFGRNSEDEVVENCLQVEQEKIDELPDVAGYILRSNSTEHQLELFEKLVNAHHQFFETSSDEDLKNYAAAIVRNFVADFFTLSNKKNRPDVGGLQFFSDEVVDNFRSFAIDEFYLYLNQYIEMFGSESLPTVASTKILNVEFGTRMIGLEADNSEISKSNASLAHKNRPNEEVGTIIVDVEWKYDNSTLHYIDEFQTAARFTLVPYEKNVKIFVIELPEVEDEIVGNS